MENKYSIFERCFEKHNFDELNNMDFHMLNHAFQIFLNNYKLDDNKPVIFDVGSNCGSFIKVLEKYKISENIHCFEPHPKLSDVCVEKYPYIKMNKLCLSNENNDKREAEELKDTFFSEEFFRLLRISATFFQIMAMYFF